MVLLNTPDAFCLKSNNKGSYEYVTDLSKQFFRWCRTNIEYFAVNTDGFYPVDFTQSIEILSRDEREAFCLLRTYILGNLSNTEEVVIIHI